MPSPATAAGCDGDSVGVTFGGLACGGGALVAALAWGVIASLRATEYRRRRDCLVLEKYQEATARKSDRARRRRLEEELAEAKAVGLRAHEVPTTIAEKSELEELVPEAERKRARPPAAARAPTVAAAPAAAEQLPYPWRTMASRSMPGRFYLNSQTSETTWRRPAPQGQAAESPPSSVGAGAHASTNAISRARTERVGFDSVPTITWTPTSRRSWWDSTWCPRSSTWTHATRRGGRRALKLG